MHSSYYSVGIRRISSVLRVKEMEQLLFIMLAERSAHAHVAHNGAGNTRRETFRLVVAARAVLLENAFAVIFLLRGCLGDSRLLVCRRSRRMILRHNRRQQRRR